MERGFPYQRKKRLDNTRMSGWVWKIAKGAQMPLGLKLINDRPDHYAVCPISNMALDEFVGLLSKLALKCQKTFKKDVV
jgi:hypothetical protein